MADLQTVLDSYAPLLEKRDALEISFATNKTTSFFGRYSGYQGQFVLSPTLGLIASGSLYHFFGDVHCSQLQYTYQSPEEITLHGTILLRNKEQLSFATDNVGDFVESWSEPHLKLLFASAKNLRKVIKRELAY